VSAVNNPFHIIINQNAGAAKLPQKVKSIINKLVDTYPNTGIHETSSPIEAETIISDLPEDPCKIIAVGGDGTLNIVANALAGSNHVMGIVPAGTGNDLAGALGLKDSKTILSTILDGNIKSIDTGTVSWTERGGSRSSRIFINNVGIGFDAAVAARMTKSSIGTGIIPYLINALKEIYAYKHKSCSIGIDSRTFDRSMFMTTIGNGVSSGGGFRLTPLAKLNDGLLDVCLVSDVNRALVLRVLPKTLWGKHLSHKQIEYFHAQSISCQSEASLPIHADGELLSIDAGQIALNVRPGSLNILADNRIL
jgi:diacylglycerol kinase (ATP)